MTNNTLHHVTPTKWFIGRCENTDCEHMSVKWSEKSQQHLCWSCTADAGYKTAAYMVGKQVTRPLRDAK